MTDTENDDLLDYGRLIDEAMHDIVRRTLVLVSQHGLPGNHHFYITFLTSYPGVMISDELRERYPEEMTIVVQHQFWDMEIEEDRFSLVLSFDNVKQNLTVPFDALISFADPSVKFGLQFRTAIDLDEEEGGEDSLPLDIEEIEDPGEKVKHQDNVVQLDNFRKK